MKFKFSLKNLLKIRIEIKLGMTGPARLGISAGPGRYGPRFQLGRAVTARNLFGPGQGFTTLRRTIKKRKNKTF